MKRKLLVWSAAAGLSTLSLAAQDDAAARAAAIANRDAAEERFQRLNSAVEDLWTAKTAQDRQLSTLAEEVRNLRADSSRNDTGKYATREDLTRLIKTVEEIERKREADKKLILEEFDALKRDLKKMLNAPPPSSPQRQSKPTRPDTGTEAPAAKPADPAPANQEGVWYTVESGNTLSAIVAAHNEEFKKQGKKTSVKLVQDANPGLKPTSMKVGQKIFVPVVPQ